MPAGIITLADITSADWSLELDSTAGGSPASGIGNVVQGISDVNQCVQIIITTPKGSDPLRPTFGVDLWKYLDVPINLATASIVREVTEAILHWEPRITLVKVAVTPVLDGTAQSAAHLSVTISWQLKLTQPNAASAETTQAYTTTIQIPQAAQGF